ncbi:type II toxin-antitoxin system PemK/MazF family toxin [Streptantibioticus parmotrematis]|uniref:type II toxin-antitoxin system PemK/MazF family toxin n=1 Tax=Streptantibioticus parmotrematis TaxID=2873249 RepID=UPI0033CC11F1
MAWWVAGLVVVALALVAAVADGRLRDGGRRSRAGATRRPAGKPGSRRPAGRVRPARGPAAGGPSATVVGERPRPGEIWWAEVPYEDGPGAKDRPCLVLSVRGEVARVVKITSKHHAELPGVIALPPGAVGDAQGRISYLETEETRQVPLHGFRRRVGPLDPAVWSRVQQV